MELQRYLEIILKRKWIVLQSIIFIVSVTLLASFLIKPIYKFKAKVVINPNDIQAQFISDLPGSLGKLEFFDTDNSIGTVEEYIKSKHTIERVIKQLNITDKKDIPIEASAFVNPGIIKILLKKRGVKIDQIEDSEAFEIIGYSGNPVESANIANKVAESFVEHVSGIRKLESTIAETFLENEAEKYSKEFIKAKDEIVNYMRANNIVDISQQKSYLYGRLSSLVSSLDEVKRNLQTVSTTLEATKKAMQKQPEYLISTTVIQSNPLIDTYKSQLFTLELELAELRTELTEEHPDIKITMRKKEDTESLLRAEIKKTFASEQSSRNSYYDTLVQNYSDAEIDAIVNKSKEAAYKQQINDINKELSMLPAKELELKRMEAKFDVIEDKYSLLIAQLEKARVAKNAELTNIHILEDAKLPQAAFIKKHIYFPKKTALLALALFTGSALGIFLAFVIEYYDDTLWNAEDVKRELNRKVLSVIPRIKST
ncbi:MAG: GumC family protein [Nitrospirota bacterium]